MEALKDNLDQKDNVLQYYGYLSGKEKVTICKIFTEALKDKPTELRQFSKIAPSDSEHQKK